MQVTFLLPKYSKKISQVQSLGAEMVKDDHMVRLFSQGKGISWFDGMSLEKSHGLFWQLRNVLRACSQKPDVLHFYGSTIAYAWLPWILCPNALRVYSADGETQKWHFIKYFAQKVIATSRKERDEYYAQDISSVAFIPEGTYSRSAIVDSTVLESHGLRSHGYVLALTNQVEMQGILRETASMQEFFQQGMSIALLDSESSQKTSTVGFVELGKQVRDVREILFAGASLIFVDEREKGSQALILEAMSYGKPVMVFGGKQDLDSRIFPHVISVDDVEEVMEEILQKTADKMELAAIGHTGRTLVETVFSWKVLADDTLSLYTKGLAVHGGILSHALNKNS